MTVGIGGPTAPVTPAAAAAAGALGTAGVTAVTGTGAAVLSTAPTLTGATVNELTPAKIANLDTLAAGGWLDRFAKVAAIYAPGAAEVREFLSQNFPASANAAAVAMHGGGLTYANSTPVYLGPVCIVNPKVDPWAVAFDMETIAPATGHFAWWGIKRAAGSDNNIGLWNNYDSAGAGGAGYTQVFIRSYNGASNDSAGWAPDTARHAVVLAFDGTSIRLIVDGVVKATMTDLSHVDTNPMGPFAYSDAGSLKISRIAIATVS